MDTIKISRDRQNLINIGAGLEDLFSALLLRGADMDNIISRHRQGVKATIYSANKGRSDVSRRKLGDRGHLHEGIFPRSVVPASINWHYKIFHPYNCFLLSPEEHIPNPPSRELCYWLAVANYSKAEVDAWIESLPFKVRPPTPWVGTYGQDVVNKELPRFKPVTWPRAYAPFYKDLDQEG